MVKVTIYPPPGLYSKKIDNFDNTVELPDNATLRNVYRILKIPIIASPLLYCCVNNEKSKLSRKLKDGDKVSFFSLVSGG